MDTSPRLILKIVMKIKTPNRLFIGITIMFQGKDSSHNSLEVEDKQVVLLTLERGEYHYGVLVNKYADFLYALGMSLTHGDYSLAEDIAQETFLRSFKYLHRFDSRQNHKKWLIGIL